MASRQSNKSLIVAVVCGVMILSGGIALLYGLVRKDPPLKNVIENPPPRESVRLPETGIPIPGKVIDYNNLRKDADLKKLMQERKKKYGLEKGVDLIVKSDEVIKIGGSTIKMRDIQESISLKTGDIIEKEISRVPASGRNHVKEGRRGFTSTGRRASKGFGSKSAATRTSAGTTESTAASSGGTPESVQEFGIYVVQPQDNIWNIHFLFLKDYFDHKGIPISPVADEPNTGGYSSGIGKILKFSENVVHIYNIRERRLVMNLHLVHPLSKIVVYNMQQIYKLLDRIDYKLVNRIQFDGDTLWLPPADG